MRDKKTAAGSLAVMLSSVLFGLTPILARISYTYGNTSINMVFLRALIALPFLFLIMRVRRIPLRPAKTEIGFLVAGGFCSVFTTLLLYSSYNYIDVGIATTLHFSYPLIVVVISTLFFKERPTVIKLLSLALGLAGIFILADFGSAVSLTGIMLAVLSAFTFAAKVILLGKSVLQNSSAIRTTFYFCLVEAPTALTVGLFTRNIVLAFAPSGWILIVLVAVLASVVAVPCLSYGISCVGSSTASILSTLEPITSILLGVLLLNEPMTIKKLIGCALIFTAVVAVLINKPQTTAPAGHP